MTWASLFRRRPATMPVAVPMPASALASPDGPNKYGHAPNTCLNETRLRLRALRLCNRDRVAAEAFVSLHLALKARFGDAEVTG